MTATRGVLLATGLVTALCWSLFATQGANPKLEEARISVIRDFVGYYRPNAEYLGNRLAGGELPLWNPVQALGQPFLASIQPGTLYPPNALHAWLPAQSAFVLLAAFHLTLAAAFAAALARSLGASLPGAAVAGLLYGASVRLFAEVWIPPALYVAAWMPALLLATERAVARPGPRRAFLLAAALALQLLVGWPYGVAMTALACAIYGGVSLIGRTVQERRVPYAAVVALGAGVVGGLALAAPQLLPSIELLAQSCRALGSLSATQAIAGLSGHDPGLFFERLLEEGGNSAVPSLPAVALVALGVARPPSDRLRPWALFAIGLLTLAASFPDHLPVYDALRTLPVLGDFRFPFRYRGVTLLMLAILAGLGVSWAGHRFRDRRWLQAALVAALAAAAVLPALRVAPRGAAAFPRTTHHPVSEAARLRALGAPHVDGFRRVFWAERTEKIHHAGDLQIVSDLEPLSLARTARLLTFLEFGEPRTFYGLPPGRVDEGPTQPFAGLLGLPDTPARARIVDLLAADLVVTRKPKAWLAERYRALGAADAAERIYANPHALPHAYRVALAEPEPADPREALERLVAADFDPRRSVLLDPLPEAHADSADGIFRAEDTRVEHYAPERVRVSTRGSAPGFVVLTDTWFPGWEVRVDGAPATLLRANTVFRAVSVPAGEHTIEFRFRPRSLRTGLAAAAAALVGFVVMTILWRRTPGKMAG